MKFPGLEILNVHYLQGLQITALSGHAKYPLMFWKGAPLICLSFPTLCAGC